MGRLLNIAKIGAPWPAVGGIVWLLLDRFTTDRAAGSVDATLSEPSGHARTLTDTGGTATITAGQFKVTATAGLHDPWLRYTTGWARVAGRMLRFDMSYDNLSSGTWLSGWANTLSSPNINQTMGWYTSSITIVGTPTAAIIQSYTPPTTISTVIILRSTGHFVLIDGKLRVIYRADNTAIMYPSFMARAADAALDIYIDNIGVVDLDITRPTLFPTPTLSDTFSDTSAPLLSDGLAHIEAGGVNGAGVQWNGVGTFSNLGNKAYISPTPGAELLTNGSFAAWTADNPDGWTIIGEVGADPEVSEVGTGEGHGGVGTGLANLYASAANNPSLRQDVLTLNEFYRVGVTIDTVIDPAIFVRDLGGNLTVSYGTTGVKTHTGRCSNITFQISGVTFPIDVTIDNATAKLLTFADCLRAVAPASAAEPYASAKLTITDTTQAGLVINLDDYTTPANCIHVWYDRVNSKVYARELTAGTWGADTLAGIAATYSAGAYLEIRRIGTEVYVYYNLAYVGSWTTALTSANTQVALFATDSASYAESVTVYPTGSYDHSDYA